MKRGMGWPIGIVAILLAGVVGNLAVIVITKDDPSFSVEPDYYRKAVDWDERMRLDLDYVEHWLAALDLVIVAKTVKVVLTGKGAY